MSRASGRIPQPPDIEVAPELDAASGADEVARLAEASWVTSPRGTCRSASAVIASTRASSAQRGVGRLRELAFRLPDKGDNAGNTAYVKLRNAVTCSHP